MIPYLSCTMYIDPNKKCSLREAKVCCLRINYLNLVVQVALNPTQFIIAKLASCQTTDLHKSWYHGRMAIYMFFSLCNVCWLDPSNVPCLVIPKKKQFWPGEVKSSSRACSISPSRQIKKHCRMCQPKFQISTAPLTRRHFGNPPAFFGSWKQHVSSLTSHGTQHWHVWHMTCTSIQSESWLQQCRKRVVGQKSADDNSFSSNLTISKIQREIHQAFSVGRFQW